MCYSERGRRKLPQGNKDFFWDEKSDFILLQISRKARRYVM